MSRRAGRPKNMDIQRAIEALEAGIADPRNGLPEEVFLFVSRITPLVNVDLLIQDEGRGTLLTWRDDAHHGAGWHLPGGIVRFQETAAERVRAVARQELGAEVEPETEPLMLHEAIDRSVRTRGHLYSLLFRCVLLAGPAPALRAASDPPRRDQWRWHRSCPEDLLSVQRHYRRFLG